MAPTWTDAITGTTDGLTTNGIAILRPVGVFESGVNPDQWHEITVMGNVRQMRPNRLVREPGAPVIYSLIKLKFICDDRNQRRPMCLQMGV